MKLYYTSSIRTNIQNKEIFGKIKEIAKDLRYDLSAEYSKFDGVEDYAKLNDDQAFDTFRKAQRGLKDADVLIAEVSHPSDRIGYEVATAIAEKKPVLAIIRDGVKLAPPVQGNQSKYLTVVRYSDIKDLDKTISDFLIDAKKRIDTKFILIISPQIDKYLEWASQERRQHKAQVVRESIEFVMGKDAEYKQYQKRQEQEE